MQRPSRIKRGVAALAALAIVVSLTATTGIAASSDAANSLLPAEHPPPARLVSPSELGVSAANPDPHFSFGRILGQATPTLAATATATATGVTSTPTLTTTPTTATPTVSPTIGAPPQPPISGTPGVPCTTVVGGTCSSSGGVTGTWTKTSSGVFTFTATGPGNAIVGVTPTIFIPTTANAAGEQFPCSPVSGALTTTCSGTTAGDILQGATITIAFPLTGGGFGNVTGTVIGTNVANNLTPAQAQAQAQATSGFQTGLAGVPCALFFPGGLGPFPGPGIGQINPGQTCTVTGAVSGTLTRTGSMTFTLTATVPAGVPAGITPVAVFSTDAGIQTAVCAAATGAAGTAYTCTGAIAGNALQNSSVALCFTAATTCLLGTVTGQPGPLPPPLPPPFPPLFPPPPPPPLLFPPPPPPPPSLMGPIGPIGPNEIPLIPEADSLVLLGGGLLVLGAAAGWRQWRRRRA